MTFTLYILTWVIYIPHHLITVAFCANLAKDAWGSYIPETNDSFKRNLTVALTLDIQIWVIYATHRLKRYRIVPLKGNMKNCEEDVEVKLPKFSQIFFSYFHLGL